MSFSDYANDFDNSTSSIRSSKDGHFSPSDAARRFTWAYDELQGPLSPGQGLLGFPGFFDNYATAPAPPDLGAFRDTITFFPSRRTISRPIELAASESVPDPYKPQFGGALIISPDGIDHRFEQHRSEESVAYAQNDGSPASIMTYFAEAWYFVPVHIALQLQRAGYHREALDWFRSVYDYTAPLDQRRIAALLARERPPATSAAAQGFTDYRRDANWDWLGDPLNPHRIARTRANTYTRFTNLSIIRCLLEYGESEFTRDTPESVPVARLLFESALELLESADLVQRYGNRCEDLIGRLELKYGDEYLEVVNGSHERWAESLALGSVEKLVPELDKILASGKSAANKREEFAALVESAVTSGGGSEKVGELLDREAELRAEATDAVMMSAPVAGYLARLDTRGDAQASAGAVIASGDAAFVAGAHEFERPASVRIPAAMITACLPPNPLLRALRLRAEANLYKIRTCRNISGVKRELDTYAAPTDTVTGLPSIGSGGQLSVPGLAPLRPTPYRYLALIGRAKEMVQLAQQLETSMLSALQQRDNEAYGLLKARQDVRHSRAVVTLQDLRINEAQDEVQLAELERDRASIQMETYEEWINEGLLAVEEVIVAAYIVGAVAQAANAIASPWAGAQAPNFGFAAAAAASGAVAAAAQGVANVASVYANLERRKQEWNLARDIARQDIAIGNQQIRVANDRKQIVSQEHVIAQLEADNADRTVEFLAGKFTNAELYDWMAAVLEGVYRYFLQQATAMAQLASAQLAFERQETPPPYIRADYWEPLAEAGSGDGPSPDRRGLTGSARLLQDIYQLDQYWFDTNTRKLQLSKTISLAQLAPVEFQRFRESGVITFATPMELFDRDFPGHYLRLIKRVRTSVVALVPPTEGIRAMLTSARVSRVVTGGDIFQTVRVQHGPDAVALTAPRDATGVFELEPQQELLAPFEGIGVDAFWEFRMPRASNPIDYDAIADVLITVDYSALNSFDYGSQVAQKLGRTISADRAYSFRNEFSDAWYDLHNPDETLTPMTVAFEIGKADFPPNLEDLRIAQVALFFASSTDSSAELQVNSLTLTEVGSTGKIGGAAATSAGLISTRRGNAGSWLALLGESPVGTWELALSNTSTVRQLFETEQLDDILFVVTYSGRLPEWPT
jgi:Tc toxin complex TcA C-terminal TcB-binding domain